MSSDGKLMSSGGALSQRLEARVSGRRLQRTAEWLAGGDGRPGDDRAGDGRAGAAGLQETYEELARRCQQAGADEVQLQSFGFGPTHRYFGWSDDRRPLVRQAELWLVEPDGREELLCRASEAPGSLIGALRSTEPDGELFEVVEVGVGTRAADYRSRRLAGRVALIWGPSTRAALLEALGDRQAAGALVGPDLGPAAAVLGPPTWYEGGRPFAFRLTADQRDRLASRVAVDEPIKVRVRIEATLGDGELPLVSARLAGSDRGDEQVVLVAATGGGRSTWGAACLIELLGCVSRGVVDGLCAPPRRALRLLLVPDQRATVAWLADPARGAERTRAALHLDARDDLDGHGGLEGALRVEGMPPGSPSWVTDAVRERIAASLGAEPSVLPYRWGSPVFAWLDPSVAVPACRLGVAPGRLAERPGAMVAALAAAAIELASVERADLPRLISNAQVDGAARLAGRGRRLQRRLRAALDEDGDGRCRRHLLWLTRQSVAAGLAFEVGALRSVVDYLDGPGDEAVRLATATGDLEQAAEALERSLHAEIAAGAADRSRLAPRRRPLSPVERRADGVVVERLVEGPPPLPRLSHDVTAEDRRWLADHERALAAQPLGELLLAEVDGQRSVRAICDRLALEQAGVDLRLVWRYLELLQAAGLVRLVDRDPCEVSG